MVCGHICASSRPVILADGIKEALKAAVTMGREFANCCIFLLRKYEREQKPRNHFAHVKTKKFTTAAIRIGL